MKERFTFETREQAEDEARQIEETFRRSQITHPSRDQYETASRQETALDKRAEVEAHGRPERIRVLEERAERLFPGKELAWLRDEIRTSFDVPQFGPYHNEGNFMDTHLALIFERLDEARDGKFDASVPEEIRPLITRVVREERDFFEKYVFLHDLRKKDCLTVTYLDGEKVSGSWKDWKASLPPEAQHDPRALRAHSKQSGIRSISYFQDRGRGRGGFVQHGEDATRYLEMRGVPLPKGMRIAIREHEVAYQFSSVHADTYRRHFQNLTARERELAIVATYLDSASSLSKDGGIEAQIKGVKALLDSKYNYELLTDIHAVLGRRPDVNQVLLDRELARLEKAKERIREPKEEVVRRLAEECRTR